MRSLINILDLSVEEIDKMLDVADDIIANREKYSEVCHGKKLATLFFEPSTRTRLSFEAAMYELGGNVLGFSAAASSSASKGESVADTTRMACCYADTAVTLKLTYSKADNRCGYELGENICVDAVHCKNCRRCFCKNI